MPELQHHDIDIGGESLHVTSMGEGPPVVFCHGFPGLSYSWRYQMPAIAASGRRAIAVDQRGFGRSSRPTDPAVYDANYVMNDMLAVLDTFKEKSAVFVGHDFGAQQVCNMAVRHPERVAGVVVMSCPYDYDLAGRYGQGLAAKTRPSEIFAEIAKKHFFHMNYFQLIGPPERELGARPGEFLQRLFWALSGEGTYSDYVNHPSEGRGYLDILPAAPPLPWPWMSEHEFDHYLTEFMRLGPDLAFIGGLNLYRNADRNWELGEAFAEADILRPALFISGARDIVLQMIAPDALDVMRRRVPDLRGVEIIEGAGHFVQMERAEEVNRALLNFLDGLEGYA
jgi:pimeloyl-ACP methyl ester carboxylesterase